VITAARHRRIAAPPRDWWPVFVVGTVYVGLAIVIAVQVF
jgi:hypothetical protein